MATLLYFGKLADVTGMSMERVALPGNVASTQELREWVDAKYGGSGALLAVSIRLAINSEIAAEPAPVSDADEVAFMPPVGGG